MPVNHALWTVGPKPIAVSLAKMPSEQQLEDMIVAAPHMLSGDWLLIGRQEPTGYGGRIDLLAIAPDASLILIELKRDKTPREIVAQALDYAAWVETLTADRIAQIFRRFSGGQTLDEAFATKFGLTLDEDALNATHQIVLVASSLDPASERIIAYLNARGIAINTLFFQVFQHGPDQLLSRAWLINPGETPAGQGTGQTVTAGLPANKREPWNGEYYVSYSDDRPWEDARQLGFVSGGNGEWYSKTLKMLSPGDRVWVNVPQVGYVGVGRVTEAVQPVRAVRFSTPDGERSALDVLSNAQSLLRNADDPALAEYYVRVAWLDAVPKGKAFSEVGLFGNQNTVCQPTTPKWRHTVDRLKSYFTKWDATDGTTATHPQLPSEANP